MAELTDISDIASLAATLHRTANMASHFAALCEEKDATLAEKDTVIAERDAAIIALRKELEEYYFQ